MRVALGRAQLLALSIAVAVVHGREIAFGFTSLDDLTLLVDDRPFLTSAGAAWRAFGRAYFHVVDAAHAYYRPVVTASYVLDTRAFGGAPSGYHATNVALHLVATCLAFALLLRARIRGGVALGAALAFAMHPALVSTVAWVPGRNDSLLAIFALAAVLTYGRGGAWRALHVASFTLALFTKETAVVVPLLSIAWGRLVERRRDDYVVWGTWGAALGAFAFARQHVLAAAPVDWHAPLRHFTVLVSSAGSVLFPANLAPIATIEDTPVWPGAVALVVLAGLALVLARRGLPLRMPVVAFGASLYLLALVPSLFVAGSLTLENRLYLPSVGVLVVLAEIAQRVRVERALALSFSVVTGLALASLTFGAASAYRDPLAFGRAAVAGAPHSALAHVTLARARELRGDVDGAIGEYAYAVALDPGEPIAHNNLGVLYMRRGDWARAEREFEEELKVNPDYGVAVENLALVRRHLGGGNGR